MLRGSYTVGTLAVWCCRAMVVGFSLEVVLILAIIRSALDRSIIITRTRNRSNEKPQ